MKHIVLISMLGLATAVLAATIPSGWSTHTDRKQVCQYATPPDWTADSLTHALWSSPNDKNSVVVSGVVGATLAQAKSIMEGNYPPVKVFEDTSSRLWYAYKGSPNTTNWYVGIAAKSDLVCGAQISFKEPGAESVMKQIADTIAAK